MSTSSPTTDMAASTVLPNITSPILTPRSSEIFNFHKSLPDYTPSPVLHLQNLAQSLSIKTLIIKDERQRFNLPSFKPLGLSWAIRNAIIAELSESLPSPLPSTISLPELAEKAKAEQLKLITATDGKLGRIVARLGKHFGVESINTRIFVPEGIDQSVINGIKSEGAEILTAPGDFEVAVREAWLHSVATDGVLVNIDAEENYEDIPRWIVEGYSTIFHELDAQLSETPPDLVVVPVGVGGLAQAAVTHFKRGSGKHHTRILAVEPEQAASLSASLAANQRTEVNPGETILKYLNYGMISEAAWEVLKECGVDSSVVVGDDAVLRAIEDFKEDGFDCGPCGGAVLAGLRTVSKTDALDILGLGPDSTVVLICTEGA